jgi:hypothetical protein
MENPLTSERWGKYFRPKPQSIVEYDSNRQLYLSWVSKLVIKGDIRWGSEDNDRRPLQIERRFVVGYEKNEYGSLMIHTIGTKGLCKDHIRSDEEIGFLLIRRPVFGGIVVGGLLISLCAAMGVDWAFKKLGFNPPFDV